jgi:outer membrane protein assembly factor BamB
MWGAATDGERIYINLINSENLNFTLIPSNVVTTGGGWVAIDASNGTILWSVATPDGSETPGPLAVTNGVVFATSFGKPYGVLFALEATTGKILWQYQTNSSISAGVSIANDCVYLGQGISASTYLLALKVRGSLVDAYCLKV